MKNFNHDSIQELDIFALTHIEGGANWLKFAGKFVAFYDAAVDAGAGMIKGFKDGFADGLASAK